MGNLFHGNQLSGIQHVIGIEGVLDRTHKVEAIFADRVAADIEPLADAMHIVAREARTIEGRLSKEEWIVGSAVSATDMVIFPWIQLLRRALRRDAARELGARFLPMEKNYPALARWIQRVEALPGYERTYPPHWRES